MIKPDATTEASYILFGQQVAGLLDALSTGKVENAERFLELVRETAAASGVEGFEAYL